MTPTTLTVMTYNVLQGGRRGQPVHDVVRAVAPDVLLVNESPKGPLTWRRRCRRLAERSGLRYAAGGRPAGSNLVAVAPAVGVASAHSEVLPQPRLRPRRGIVAVQLRVRGRLVGVVSCHLSLHRESRRVEVARVIELAGTLRGPVVVAGDLNEPPGGPCWVLLHAAGFVDHGDPGRPTFPADRPSRRLDAVLVRGDVEVTGVGVPDLDAGLMASASDHLPVVAGLRW